VPAPTTCDGKPLRPGNASPGRRDAAGAPPYFTDSVTLTSLLSRSVVFSFALYLKVSFPV
jgi:hypothetical protein